MSLKRRLSLRCILWAVSLSGCAGVTVPEGRQVPTHAEHDLVIDNHSSGSLEVHVGRTKAEAKDHRIGTWEAEDAPVSLEVR